MMDLILPFHVHIQLKTLLINDHQVLMILHWNSYVSIVTLISHLIIIRWILTQLDKTQIMIRWKLIHWDKTQIMIRWVLTSALTPNDCVMMWKRRALQDVTMVISTRKLIPALAMLSMTMHYLCSNISSLRNNLIATLRSNVYIHPAK